MIDDSLMEYLLKRALSDGGDFADIYAEQRRGTVVQFEDGRMEKAVSGSVSGIGIRLVRDRKTAYAYSNDFSRQTLERIADTVRIALSKSNVSGTPGTLTFNMKRRYPEVHSIIKLYPGDVSMNDKISLVREGDNGARRLGSAVKQVSVVYRDSIRKVQIFSSDGFIAEEERVYTTASAHVITVKGNCIQTGYEAAGGLVGFELFDDISVGDIGYRAAERAVRMLDAARAPGGRMPVVISSEAGGTMIHEAIGHGLEADLAQRGLSVYSGKVGQRIASSLITVVDDATLHNKRGSFSFDDEGTPSKRNVLVKDGILMGYMYDKYTAAADGVESSGNGRRESFENKPIPRMTNTFIAPGRTNPDDVIRSVAKGLFVKKMGGGQVNTVNGDFVFDVQEGYLIENGQVGDLVRGATLTGNGPQVLESIDMIGSDLGFSIGTCGKDAQGVPVSDAMPTLRIREIVVGGEVG
ncbi:MAG TPA: TldD/PmbA family protein [Dissulfurispiraceae bacterium]|nr:TldD/PmbA family protein [Dissulfurispiraceae bacterium]